MDRLTQLIEPVASVPGPLSLGLSIRHYLGLVDYTDPLPHPNKRGRIDGSRPSVLEAPGAAGSDQREVLRMLDVTDAAWTAQVQGTETHYHRVIGAAEQILAYAEEIGQHWLQGIGVARLLSERRRKPRAV